MNIQIYKNFPNSLSVLYFFLVLSLSLYVVSVGGIIFKLSFSFLTLNEIDINNIYR